jgi:Tfp pilus assembly major pilin PilA
LIQLANELSKLPITTNSKLITFDIKDLYVNIPIDETINITKTLLSNKKIDKLLITQACTLLSVILKQNYLQFNNKYYQPNKGVTIGSPICGSVAEIFLQYYENLLIKNQLDTNINYYNRYVDDILIIYDSTKISATRISEYLNNIHKNLQFKQTDEDHNTISFLDLLVTRNHLNLTIDIYRKPTSPYITNPTTQHNIKWQHTGFFSTDYTNFHSRKNNVYTK